MVKRLILLSRRAHEGRVKTRLCPPLTPAQAVRLYRGFVADGMRFLAGFRGKDCQVERCVDRLWRNPLREGIPVTPQGDGNLGQRMLRAVRRAAGDGADAVVILGADAPTLPATRVHDAIRLLEEGADAVLTPAEDGGYVMIALRRPIPCLFRNIPWGSSRVLQATRKAARENGLLLAETEGWYDVDRPDDLIRLHRELNDDTENLRAPRTLAALREIWTGDSPTC